MIQITNTYIILDKEYVISNPDKAAKILDYLTYTDKQTGETQLMYYKDGDIIKIPVGYLQFLPVNLGQPSVVDLRLKTAPELSEEKEDVTIILDKIKKILPGITLRDDQAFSVFFALSKKSGIFQLATGSGKTEIISAIIKYWQTELNYFPNIIILEPTTKLVTQTIDRFKKYGIDATEYNCDRVIEGIKVTHPASLYNDLDKNPDHLAKLQCIICDEGHHLSAVTWRAILDNAKYLEARLAFSASIIDQDRINFKSLTELDYDEHLIVGVTGKVWINFPPAYYIKNNILATPVVFRIYNEANEPVKLNKSWKYSKYGGIDYHQIKKKRIGSDARIKKCASVAIDFAKQNLKILILAETKDFAFSLLTEIANQGYGNIARTIFGGNEAYQLTIGGIQKEDQDPIEMLTNGQINIVLATSVMYEGADIPVLDVVILFSVGVEQRVFIQAIGRVLRKGKTGKYAYIIDFTDHTCSILKKHSLKRKDMYLSVIGVSPELIFDGIQTQNVLQQYLSLEKKDG